MVGPINSTQSRNVQGIPPVPPMPNSEGQSVQQVRPTGIQTIVLEARPMDAQPARAEELAQQPPASKWTIKRILLACFTLGLSEGVRAIHNRARMPVAAPARVVAPEVPATVPNVAQYNTNLALRLSSREPLPEDLQEAANDTLNEMKLLWEDMAPTCNTIQEAPHQLLDEVYGAMRSEPTMLNAESLASIIKEKIAEQVQLRLLTNALTSAREAVGHESKHYSEGYVAEMLKHLPVLATALKACEDVDEVKQTLNTFKDYIRQYAENIKMRDEAKTQAMERAVTMLSENLGLKPEQVKARISFEKLNDTINIVNADLHFGMDANHVRNTLNVHVERFVEKITANYMAADRVEGSTELRNFFKTEALAKRTIPSANFFQDCVNVAESIQDAAKTFVIPLFADANTPTPEEFFGALQRLSNSMAQKLKETFAGSGQTFGAEEVNLAQSYVIKSLFNQMPKLRTLFREDPELTRDVKDLAYEENIDNADKQTIINGVIHMLDAFHPSEQNNIKLAEMIRKQELLPTSYLIAFEQSLERLSFAFPELATDEKLVKHLTSVIAATVGSTSKPISPEEFATITNAVVLDEMTRDAIAPMIADLAKSAGIEPSSDVASQVQKQFCARHPELAESASPADLKAKINALRNEISALIVTNHAIDNAWSEQKARVLPELAKSLNMAEDTLREQLDMFTFSAGGAFGIWSVSLTKTIKDPKTLVENFPTVDAIKAEFKAITDRFITKKIDLCNYVDQQGFSPSHVAFIKKEILSTDGFKDLEFLKNCVRVTERITLPTLATALNAADVADDDAYILLKSKCEAYNANLNAVFTKEKLDTFGTEDINVINRFAITTFLDRNPSLRELTPVATERLNNFSNRILEEINDIHARIYEHSIEEHASLIQALRPANFVNAFISELLAGVQ